MWLDSLHSLADRNWFLALLVIAVVYLGLCLLTNLCWAIYIHWPSKKPRAAVSAGPVKRHFYLSEPSHAPSKWLILSPVACATLTQIIANKAFLGHPFHLTACSFTAAAIVYHFGVCTRPFLTCHDALTRSVSSFHDASNSPAPYRICFVPPDCPNMSPWEWLVWFFTSQLFLIGLWVLTIVAAQSELLYNGPHTPPEEATLGSLVKNRLVELLGNYWPLAIAFLLIFRAVVRAFARRKIRFKLQADGSWDVLRSSGIRSIVSSGQFEHIKRLVLSSTTMEFAWFLCNASTGNRLKLLSRHYHASVINVVLSGEPSTTLPVAVFPTMNIRDSFAGWYKSWLAPGALPVLVAPDKPLWGAANEAWAACDHIVWGVAEARRWSAKKYRSVRQRMVEDKRHFDHAYLGVPASTHGRRVTLPWKAFVNERIHPLSTYLSKPSRSATGGLNSGLGSTVLALIRNSLNLVTIVAAFGMVVAYVLALQKYGIAMLSEFKLVPEAAGEGHGKFLESALQAIELMILAPLPYLLMLGLSRYVDAVTSGKDTKKAKAELLNFKGFEVALLIGATGALLVSAFVRFLGTSSGGDPKPGTLWLIGVALGAIGILALYYFKLEEAADEEEKHVRANPSDVLPFELHAQRLRRESRFLEAGEVYEQAGHFVLAHSDNLEDSRGFALMAHGELCRIRAHVEEKSGEAYVQAKADFLEHLLAMKGVDSDKTDRHVIPVIMLGKELKLSAEDMGLSDWPYEDDTVANMVKRWSKDDPSQTPATPEPSP